MLIKNIL